MLRLYNLSELRNAPSPLLFSKSANSPDMEEKNGITMRKVSVVLTDLTVLNLNSNHVRDISPLANLTNLVELGLSSNSITTGVARLVTLTHAEEVRLTMNKDVPCGDIEVLVAALGENVVVRPEHCIRRRRP